jgi:hypothetical protein
VAGELNSERRKTKFQWEFSCLCHIIQERSSKFKYMNLQIEKNKTILGLVTGIWKKVGKITSKYPKEKKISNLDSYVSQSTH